MNDPNGLIRLGQTWHLYYQWSPERTGGLKHWGHATSTDLLTWDHHPVALSPDEHGQIFSGSSVQNDQNELVAVFTHHQGGFSGTGREFQSIAVSADDGMTFPEGPFPVLDRQRADFRDPKVWREGSGYRMAVSALKSCEFYASDNLREWRQIGEFTADELPGYDWECPDLIALPPSPYGDDRASHALIGSFIVPGAPHETWVWLGTWADGEFRKAGPPHRLSFGPDDYAAVSFGNLPAEESPVIIGWMNRWDYATATPARDYIGEMTLPRRLGLLSRSEGWRLVQTPAVDMPLTPFPAVCEYALPARLSATLRAGEAIRLEFGGIGPVTVERDHTGALVMSRAEPTHVPHAAFAGRFASRAIPEAVVEVDLWVDHHSVEVFAPAVAEYGAMLIFPTEPRFTVHGPGR